MFKDIKNKIMQKLELIGIYSKKFRKFHDFPAPVNKDFVKSFLDNNITDELLDNCINFFQQLKLDREYRRNKIATDLENVASDKQADSLSLNKEPLEDNVKSQNEDEVYYVYEKLMAARACKRVKDYNQCQLICEEILQKYPDDIYTKNMLISVLGKMGNLKVFSMLEQILVKGMGCREDVQYTIYGVLGAYTDYPKTFLKALLTYQKDILLDYYNLLSDANPKKDVLEEYLFSEKIIKKKRVDYEGGYEEDKPKIQMPREGVVEIGDTVEFIAKGRLDRMQITTYAGNPDKGQINYESALARALLDGYVGDVVDVNVDKENCYSVRITKIIKAGQLQNLMNEYPKEYKGTDLVFSDNEDLETSVQNYDEEWQAVSQKNKKENKADEDQYIGCDDVPF